MRASNSQPVGRTAVGNWSTPSKQLPSTPSAKSPSAPTEPVHTGKFVRANTPPKIDAKLPDPAAWIIIASRPTPEEATLIAEQYVQSFPSTTVIRSASQLPGMSLNLVPKISSVR